MAHPVGIGDLCAKWLLFAGPVVDLTVFGHAATRDHIFPAVAVQIRRSYTIEGISHIIA
jgi:hypothetical protein